MKSMKKIFGILAILAILVVAGAVIAVKTMFPAEKIKKTIEVEASNTIGREIKVGDIGLSIWPLGLEIESIKVAGPSDSSFSSEPSFTTSGLVFELDLGALLGGQASVNQIQIGNFHLNFEINQAGQHSFYDLSKERVEEESKPLELPTLPFEINLKSFSIKNGSISYDDQLGKNKFSLGELNQELSLYVSKDLSDIKTEGQLDLKNISFESGSQGIKKGNMNISLSHLIKANLKEETLNLDKVAFSLLGMEFNLRGTASEILKAEPQFDVKIKSNQVDLNSLISQIPANINPQISKVKAGGTWELNLSAKGTPKKQDIDGGLSLNKISISHTDSPAKIENLNGEILFSPEYLKIPNLSLLVGKNPVSVRLILTQLLKTPTLEQLKIAGKIDLDNIIPIVESLGAMPDSVKASGLIDFSLAGDGLIDPDNLNNLNLIGGAEFKKLKLKLPGIKPEITTAGKTKISKSEINVNLKTLIGQSDVATSIQVNNALTMVMPKIFGNKHTTVLVNVKSNKLSLDELMPPPSKEEAEKSEPAEIFPELPPVDVEINVNLKETQFKHLALTNFIQKTTIKNSVVKSNFTANLYGGNISQTLSTNLTDRQNAKVNFNLKTKNVEFNDLISRLNNNLEGDAKLFQQIRNLDNTIFGKSDLDIDISTFGNPKTLANNLSGELSSNLFDGYIAETKLTKGYNSKVNSFSGGNLKNLSVDKLSFSKFFSQLDIVDGKFIVKHLDLKGTPLGFLALEGDISFEGGLNLSLINHLPQSISKSILSTQNSATGALSSATGVNLNVMPTTDKGEVKAYYFITGTLDDPKYGLDTKRMASEGTSGAKASLAAEKKKLEDKAKAKLNAEKAKATAKVNKVVEENKTKAKKAVKKETDKVKTKAKDKAKKVLKGFGF